MCGRLRHDPVADDDYGRIADLDAIVGAIRRMGTLMESTFNLAPGTQMPVLVQNRDGEIVPRLMNWGLIRQWAKPGMPTPSNARAETILDKPMFRDLVASRRCVTATTGYYEWMKSGRRSIPHCISMAQREVMLIAGIYDAWLDDSGRIVESYSMITTTAAESIAHIHGRMPVLLEPHDCMTWLSRDVRDLETVMPMMKPFPGERLKYWQVSDRVNDTNNDGRDLMDPVVEERQVAMF